MTEPKPESKPEPKPINIDSKISVNDNDGDVTGTKVGGDATNQNNLSLNLGSSDLDRYSNRELQMMIVNAMERSNHAAQSMEVRYYEIKKTFERQVREDHEDRHERQKETDEHRIHLNERITALAKSIDERIDRLAKSIDEAHSVQNSITAKIDRIETWILVIAIAVGIIFFIMILVLFIFIAFRLSPAGVLLWLQSSS